MGRSLMLRILMSFVATAVLVESVLAVDHNVGAPNGGWNTNTDLQSWATSQTFSVGDNLVFQYGPTHDVLEVSKGDYDACGTSNPISTDASGSTTIPLNAAGSRYFICGTPGHCAQGMKVQIDVVAASATPPPTTTPTPPPPPPGPSSPRSSPVPPASGPTTKSPANPVPSSETLYPPSAATTMTGRLAMVFGLLMMVLLSP